MKVYKAILIVLTSFLVLGTFCSEVFGQSQVAGIIQEIKGTVYWKKNRKTKPIRLDPRHDQARIVYVGEEVRTERDGFLQLVLCDDEKKIIQGRRSAWFLISTASECPNRKAFQTYRSIGGRKRGKGIQIFSPSAHSAITPDLFVIRWTPGMAKCILTLAIRQMDGSPVWEEENIDGSLGYWDSPQARQKLTKYREDGEEAPLRLNFIDSCANRVEISFSLLSVEKEVSLKNELQQWDKNPVKLMVHIGRAHVFETYRLFPQVTEEYEAALKLAPESHDLLVRTVWSHRNTGNYARELELISRLPPGTVPQ